MTRSNELPELQSTSIHEALASASLESKESNEMVKFSVRIPEETKDAAQFICERNGTSLGTYLRHCATALVEDYQDQQLDDRG